MNQLPRPTRESLQPLSHTEWMELVLMLFDRIDQLTARVNELEAQANKTSKNSHKPPSSDGLKRQPAQPRQPGQRPKGGQPGHKGHSLVMHPSPDHVEYYGVAGHCDCGLPLTAALIETGECRQQWDIPEPQIVVTEHRQLICTCGCGNVHKGEFPATLAPYISYGARCHVSHDAVEGTIDRCMSVTVDWADYTQLYTLGIDEIALKKGHKDFVAIITTLDQKDRTCVLAILPNRLKETVVAFFNRIPVHLKATVRRVCCDMHEGYSNAVKETLPAAQVVVDRFHVAQYYNKAVDTLRKETLHTLRKSFPKNAYQQHCKGALWPFRRPFWSLDEKQQAQVSHFLNHAPELKSAWLLRHELTILFIKQQTKAEANQQLEDWKQKVRASGLGCFDKFLTLLETWQDSITHYFEDRHTSGFVEGMNNKLKVIKRRCYGLLDVKRFFQQIQIDLRFARGLSFA